MSHDMHMTLSSPFNYELFNCNNFNIRYWSWNYRGCWPIIYRTRIVRTFTLCSRPLANLRNSAPWLDTLAGGLARSLSLSITISGLQTHTFPRVTTASRLL